MPGPNGQGVNNQDGNNPQDNGVGNPAGTGAPAGNGTNGVVDQEIEITTATGQKVKVKASDILDDKGVLFKNRAMENERRARAAEETAAALQARRMEGETNPSENNSPDNTPKPGEYIDPQDGQKYTEDDINRMYMTGEGLKAQRIVLGQINVRKVVSEVVSDTEMRARTMSRYPDLKNAQTPFFQRVARYMAENNLYSVKNGLGMASAVIAEQMGEEGIPFTKGRVTSSEDQRNSQTGAGAIPGSGSGRGGNNTPELDEQGMNMANKLGVDPAKLAKRLDTYLQNKVQRGRRE